MGGLVQLPRERGTPVLAPDLDDAEAPGALANGLHTGGVSISKVPHNRSPGSHRTAV